PAMADATFDESGSEYEDGEYGASESDASFASELSSDGPAEGELLADMLADDHGHFAPEPSQPVIERRSRAHADRAKGLPGDAAAGGDASPPADDAPAEDGGAHAGDASDSDAGAPSAASSGSSNDLAALPRRGYSVVPPPRARLRPRGPRHPSRSPPPPYHDYYPEAPQMSLPERIAMTIVPGSIAAAFLLYVVPASRPLLYPIFGSGVWWRNLAILTAVSSTTSAAGAAAYHRLYPAGREEGGADLAVAAALVVASLLGFGIVSRIVPAFFSLLESLSVLGQPADVPPGAVPVDGRPLAGAGKAVLAVVVVPAILVAAAAGLMVCAAVGGAALSWDVSGKVGSGNGGGAGSRPYTPYSPYAAPGMRRRL
ncbi:hypothetical protein DFJ74DRAFT_744580, partial [Hyaloraphidium curvatum]